MAPLNVPFAISWADEERDLTAWLGNELQLEAFEELYKVRDKVKAVNDPALNYDYCCLQASDHFYYMCTKLFSDGAIHQYFTPYDTPYEAFINYMNVLSDFIVRVDVEYAKAQQKAEKNKAETGENKAVVKAKEPKAKTAVKKSTAKSGGEK